MVKLQIAAGKATPAPPVGTALGPQGVNIMDFCKNFNAKTAKDEGLIIPVVVTIAGMIKPSCAAVLALKFLQKSMMLTPCGPSAVPTGGAGVALPAAICNLT